ncbi:hypothetical protein CEXT_560311 [Caerostris extrusa]|uniref:Uncharacterized protein n=1 Tax=Caerostris extrusa TaxID=172846 RepID=A0AAV4ML09_CAEEX|nr:hypothetical protein CEXT_560311 [Caerostris extrusa]
MFIDSRLVSQAESLRCRTLLFATVCTMEKELENSAASNSFDKQAWEGLIDSKEEEEDYPVQQLSATGCYLLTPGRGKSCVGPCPSPIVDLQQRIDTAGATRVFTATSGIRGIDSGEHEMMTGRPKNTLHSAGPPSFKADFPPG